jgi:hypothetical protein
MPKTKFEQLTDQLVSLVADDVTASEVRSLAGQIFNQGRCVAADDIPGPDLMNALYERMRNLPDVQVRTGGGRELTLQERIEARHVLQYAHEYCLTLRNAMETLTGRMTIRTGVASADLTRIVAPLARMYFKWWAGSDA